MHVLVNGVRLFFDVEGAKLVPDGPAYAREADTHAPPWRARLRPHDLQAGLLSLGRHRAGDLSRPSRQWAERRGSEGKLDAGAVGRRRARVLRRAGHREADRARRVVRRHGGDGLRDAASFASRQADPDQHRGEGRLAISKSAWNCSSGSAGQRSARWRGAASSKTKGTPDEAAVAAWRRLAMPHYTRTPRGADALERGIVRQDVLHWFQRPGEGEGHRFDFFPDLHRIQCPTLVMGGEDDPMLPDRGTGRYRGGTAAASRALRAVFRLRTRNDSGSAGTGPRADPRIHHSVRDHSAAARAGLAAPAK